ncbi:MAG: TGS domain-containing protein, partial [Bryobacteraceae bacterium]|nr:TGS domain-containing protein [Bryobacteraceae bacterium]
MSSIDITLPDGSHQQVPAGTTPLDVARSISSRLADDAVVARVNGEFYDLTRPFEWDAALQILTSKNPEALEVYRHSTAHLLALAVQQLYPGVRLGIGPPTDTGFYYDFYLEQAFQPEDLEKIEAKMWELQKQDLAFERRLSSKTEGIEKYRNMGEFLKSELIEEKADDVFTEY